MGDQLTLRHPTSSVAIPLTLSQLPAGGVQAILELAELARSKYLP